MALNDPGARPASLKAAAALLAAFLFVLPFSSSLTLRNTLLGLAAACDQRAALAALALVMTLRAREGAPATLRPVAKALVAAGSENTTYEEMGEMSNVGAYSVGVTYARSISEQFLVGVTVRYATQNLGESMTKSGLTKNSVGTMAADLGVKYYPGLKSFRFAMAFRNFSPQLKREEVYEQLPLTFTIGSAIDLMDFIDPEHGGETALTVSADFLHSNNYSQRLNFGAEYLMFGTLSLRGGYQTNRDIASWSAGVGVMTSLEDVELGVHYSFSRFEYFDGVNRLSLQILF